MNAKIIRFPGVWERHSDMPTDVVVEVEPEDFDTVRAALEQEVENAATSLGQCETEAEWLTTVNDLIEMLLSAALRKAPDG